MVRSWGALVWMLVLVIAAAVLAQIVLAGDAKGAPSAVGPLRLNEILAGPARDWDGDGIYDARADEWVEVQNVDTVPIPLDEYRLADADRTIRFALSGTLAAGAVRLIMGSEAVAWQRSVGLTVSGLSLNNSGDTVRILRIAGTDTTSADERAYGTIEAGSDRSVGRAGGPSDDWILFDALNRYTGSGTPAGTGCAPSPGALNGCTTDVRSTTWGAIKKLYR